MPPPAIQLKYFSFLFGRQPLSLTEAAWNFEAVQDIQFTDAPPTPIVSLQQQGQHTADLSLKSSSWKFRGNGASVPPFTYTWIVDSAVTSKNDSHQSHRGRGKLGVPNREGLPGRPGGSPVEGPQVPGSLDQGTASA